MTGTRNSILIAAILAFIMVTTTAFAYFSLKPGTRQIMASPDLTELVPAEFAAWRSLPPGSLILPAEMPDEPGVTTLYRTYINTNGEQLTLVIVHSAIQGDTMRLHLPEICYVAQGFAIDERASSSTRIADHEVPITSLVASDTLRTETVSYWMRVADDYALSQVQQQLSFLQSNNTERSDSILVRISVPSGDTDYAVRVTKEFVNDFVTHMSDTAKSYFLASGKAT